MVREKEGAEREREGGGEREGEFVCVLVDPRHTVCAVDENARKNVASVPAAIPKFIQVCVCVRAR